LGAGTLCIAAAAVAGPRELAIVDLMERLKAEDMAAQVEQLTGLHDTYSQSMASADKRLVSLALGVNYVEVNPRLALQYLSSAELATREGDPLLPIIRFYVATAKFRGGSFAESAELAARLLAQDPPLGDAWARLLFGIQIESLAETGEWQQLVDVFAEYARRFSFSRRQETLARRAAEAFERQGDHENAVRILEELARNHPATEESRWAFHKLEALSCDAPAKSVAGAMAPPRYSFSVRLLLHLARNVVLDTGLAEFLQAVVELPLTTETGEVRVLSVAEKADFFFRARLYKESLKYARQLYEVEKSNPESTTVANLVFELGRIHMRLNESMLASRYFSKFLADYPKHHWAPRAYEYLGDSMRYLGMHLAAADAYAQVAQSRDSRHIRWQQFWTLYRGRDYAKALALLETPGAVVPRDGDDESTLTFWHGRLLDRLGRKAEAREKYADVMTKAGESFYAHLTAAVRPELAVAGVSLAQASGGADGSALVAAVATPAGKGFAAKLLAPVVPAAPPSDLPGLRVVDDLLRLGLRDTAATQLSSLKWSNYGQADTFAAIGRLALVLDDYNPARRIRYSNFSALKTLPTAWWDLVRHQQQYSDEWKVYFPIAYSSIVQPVAERIHIDPFLVLSIMRAESFYNREARSPVGAQGLMQLMPYTAVKIASALRDESFDVLDLGKPEVNIAYGAYYLDKLLRYYGRNPFLAVAAYNAGPIAVNQWLEACKDCDVDEFADSIPYRETRRYVREVMRNYAQYTRIYRGKPEIAELPPMPTELPDGEELY
jgi:soluble lytic murein transglycosylase-like protein/outer membrane protein assembly factor BamD (BamD/ComL family)